jgi:hypothetical protein
MKKFRFLYIAAAALLFAACANDEDGISNNGPVAATVQADISNNIKTRGTADNNSWDSRRCHWRKCHINRQYNRRQQKVCNNKWGWYF